MCMNISLRFLGFRSNHYKIVRENVSVSNIHINVNVNQSIYTTYITLKKTNVLVISYTTLNQMQ